MNFHKNAWKKSTGVRILRNRIRMDTQPCPDPGFFTSLYISTLWHLHKMLRFVSHYGWSWRDKIAPMLRNKCVAASSKYTILTDKKRYAVFSAISFQQHLNLIIKVAYFATKTCNTCDIGKFRSWYLTLFSVNKRCPKSPFRASVLRHLDHARSQPTMPQSLGTAAFQGERTQNTLMELLPSVPCPPQLFPNVPFPFLPSVFLSPLFPLLQEVTTKSRYGVLSFVNVSHLWLEHVVGLLVTVASDIWNLRSWYLPLFYVNTRYLKSSWSSVNDFRITVCKSMVHEFDI